jgi:hypothetical protein
MVSDEKDRSYQQGIFNDIRSTVSSNFRAENSFQGLFEIEAWGRIYNIELPLTERAMEYAALCKPMPGSHHDTSGSLNYQFCTGSGLNPVRSPAHHQCPRA